MSIFQFFGLLLFTAALHLCSFMGVAFAFAGISPHGAPESTAKILKFFVSVGNVLLQMHLSLAPLYYIVIIGIFFWVSRTFASQLAKWTFALPVVSFATIALFFFIMSRVGK